MFIRKADLFNEDSICIFTDSSFKNKSNDRRMAFGTTAPAFCVYHGDKLINQGFHILHRSTSQQGELYALLLGVMQAYYYRNFGRVRIFSDSQTSIFAIRDRIFTWVRDTNNGKAVLGENGRITNQDYIMDIVYYIISNNIPMEFYHVKGHVDVRHYNQILMAKDVFINSNLPQTTRVDDALIYQIAMCNDCVDKYSTVMLKTHIRDSQYDIRGLTPAITLGYAPFDMRNYLYLVKGENIYGKDAFELSDYS